MISVLQLFALLATLFAPGYLITLACTKSYSSALLLGLPVTAGFAYSFGNYSHLIGIEFNTWWLLAELLVSAAVLAYALKRSGWPINHALKANFALAGLSMVIALVFFLDWKHASGSLSQLLPNHDAMYHSYAIRNIVNFKSNAVDEALKLYPLGAGSAANFYPLGLHSIIALGVSASGLSINTAMNVVTIGIGVCCFPFAVLAWMKTLLPRNNKVLLTALPAVLMVSTVFPLSPLSWGGMPAIVAMSLVPAIAAVIVRLVVSPSRLGSVTIAFASVGIFSIHVTELLTVGILVIVALIARGEFNHLCTWITSKDCLVTVGISAFMLLPILLSASGGAAERDLSYQPLLDLSQTAGQFMTFSFSGFTLPIAALLALIGILLSHRTRMTAIASAFIAVGITCVLAARFPENAILSKFTKPWYGQVLRLDYNVVYFAIPLIAIALVELFNFVEKRFPSRQLVMRVLGALIVATFALPALQQNKNATQKLEESWYNGLIPVNQNSVEAFKWMKNHLNEDEYVMTDVDGVDGSTWMYALENVKPIMYGAITSDARDKWRPVKFELLQSVGSWSKRRDLLNWTSRHGVRYFYFDERTNAIAPTHTMDLSALRNEQHLKEVFTRANAHVFEFKK